MWLTYPVKLKHNPIATIEGVSRISDGLSVDKLHSSSHILIFTTKILILWRLFIIFIVLLLSFHVAFWLIYSIIDKIWSHIGKDILDALIKPLFSTFWDKSRYSL